MLFQPFFILFHQCFEKFSVIIYNVIVLVSVLPEILTWKTRYGHRSVMPSALFTCFIIRFIGHFQEILRTQSWTFLLFGLTIGFGVMCIELNVFLDGFIECFLARLLYKPRLIKLPDLIILANCINEDLPPLTKLTICWKLSSKYMAQMVIDANRPCVMMEIKLSLSSKKHNTIKENT